MKGFIIVMYDVCNVTMLFLQAQFFLRHEAFLGKYIFRSDTRNPFAQREICT